MSFRLPIPPSFFQRHWRLVLAAFIFLILVGLALNGLNRAWARTRDLEKLSEINQIRSALNVYYSYRRDFPPAGRLLKEAILGEDEAICLDKTEEGLKNECLRDIIIRFPAAGYQYKKPMAGNYELNFNLARGVAGFQDANKDGRIQCQAGAETIVCL